MTNGEKLQKIVEQFRFIDSGMHAQAMSIFLYVAKQYPKEIAMTDIANACDISQASVSRNVALLSSYTRYKTKGPNLLTAKEDLHERRRKLVTLTNKGLKFYNDLEEIL